jgi:hypothetical protein
MAIIPSRQISFTKTPLFGFHGILQSEGHPKKQENRVQRQAEAKYGAVEKNFAAKQRRLRESKFE